MNTIITADMKFTVVPYKEPKKSERTWAPRSIVNKLGRKAITIGRTKCGVGGGTLRK
jgi:hypothetical protein